MASELFADVWAIPLIVMVKQKTDELIGSSSRYKEMRELDSTFITRLPVWNRPGSMLVGGANWLLHALRARIQLRRLPDETCEMTTVEQRINMYHLVTQVLCYDVPGDLVELGCFTGHSAVLIEAVIEQYAPTRELHLFDNFRMKGGVRTNIKNTLLENFRTARLRLPRIHEGTFQETVPQQLPAAIAFVHIDCGYGGDTELHKQTILYCLEHIYPRMSPGAIGLLMDYYDPDAKTGLDCNPGVKLACDEFFGDKPESVAVLYANDYSHGFFRKKGKPQDPKPPGSESSRAF